jgi:hypothetical protein
MKLCLALFRSGIELNPIVCHWAIDASEKTNVHQTVLRLLDRPWEGEVVSIPGEAAYRLWYLADRSMLAG